MPAPPSTSQKAANQKAMDAAKSGSKSYGGINTSTVKTSSKSSSNSFGNSNSNNGSYFGGINTGGVRTGALGSRTSFGPGGTGGGLLGGRLGISTPNASGSPLNNPVRTRGMNEAMRRFFSEPEDLTREAYDRANPLKDPNSFNTMRPTVTNQVAPVSPADLNRRIGAISRGPGSVAGVMPGAGPVSQRRTMQTLAGSMNEDPRFGGRQFTSGDIQGLARTIPGEAGNESPMGQTAVANTMVNRMALAAENAKKYAYMGGGDIGRLMSQYDATGMRGNLKPNAGFRTAVPGTDALGSGIASLAGALGPNSQFNQNAPPAIKNATHFYNPKISDPEWGGNGFAALGNHVFGNAEPTATQVASLRGGLSPPPTQTASLAPTAATPAPQRAMPQAETGPSMWESLAPDMLKTAVAAIDEKLVQPTQEQIAKYGGFERAGKLAQVAVAVMNFLPGGNGSPQRHPGEGGGALRQQPSGPQPLPQLPTQQAAIPPVPQLPPAMYPQYTQTWANLPTGRVMA
jgi:hypothetical protein